jgi:hypothetical protein
MSAMTAVAIAAATAAGTAGAGIYAANKQAGSAHEAATLQTDAANKAAELQAKSAADQLDYTKQQAAQARIDADTVQRANYDQWVAAQQYQNAQAVARTNALNAFGARYGVPQRDVPVMNIPAYRSTLGAAAAGPGATPPAGTPGDGSSPPAAGSPSGTPAPAAPASSNPMDPAYIQSQLAALYGQYGLKPTGPGSGPTDSAYFTQKILETGGWQGGNAAYWQSRIPKEIAQAQAGGAGRSAPASVGAAVQGPTFQMPAAPAYQTIAPPITPALTVDPYQRRTIRDYLAT